MAHPLLFDATWLQQGKFESAEAYYQQVLAGGAESGAADVSKAKSRTESKQPASSLKSEIAEARQNIQNALKEEPAVGGAQTGGGDPAVMERIQNLEAENSSLKKASEDLQSLVKKLETRVSVLEKGSGAATAPTNTPATQAKDTKDDDDDDDFELDFSDDEEEEVEDDEEKKKRLAAYYAKKEKKPTVIAKSSLVLDVKPWSDETDMAELEKCVRSISMDGLLWGASKLVAVGYGIRKLQISCVIVDDKVSTEVLEDEITAFEDFVQSMDIAAFNKI